MQVSDRVKSLKPSPTLTLNQKAKALQASGKSIVNLTAGEPDLPTPQRICDAAVAAIDRRETRYTATSGILELKQAIIDATQGTYARMYQKNEVIVTAGAKQALASLALATLNEGDEAVIFAPYWVSYVDMVNMAGAKPVVVETLEENDFCPTIAQLYDALTDRTRLVFFNSPCNPTGSVYGKAFLREAAQCLREFPRAVVVTDDIYEKFVFEGEKFHSIAMSQDFPSSQLVIVNGVSKSYAMTGWRIGYALGSAEIISAMDVIQSNSTSNPSSISQWAAVEAIRGTQTDVSTMRDAFEQRRNRCYEKLSSIPNTSCLKPKGAFYLFPNFNQYVGKKTPAGKRIANDVDLAAYFLDEGGVAIVPGSAFGAEGFVRLSYAASDEQLDLGLKRIHDALQALT